MTRRDLAGSVFHRWTVLAFAETRGHHAYWQCECACGAHRTIAGGNLTRGLTRSCGCLNSETTAARNRANTVHGQSGNGSGGKFASVEYNSWSSMLSRCRNPRDRTFHNYGGRGIGVCDRWLDFRNFYADMGARPSADHSLDRIDNDGGYEPGNCRWALRNEQGRNRRTTRMLTHDGRTLSVTGWAEEIGVNRQTVFSRLRKGLPIAEVLAPSN